jgi:LysM repeat protein
LNLFPKESFGSRGFDEFIYVTVSKGDTLWFIAKNHNYIKTDIREVIYYIEKINNLENKYIHPGQVLAIPVK